jgi:hypothetical protein
MRCLYATSLFADDGATLDDLREAVETLESVARLWKRVYGPSHPETQQVQTALKQARRVLALKEAQAALAARAAASSTGAP